MWKQLTITAVKKAIGVLKNRKAPGSDQITVTVSKARGDAMVKILEKIFQKILSTEDTQSHFPKYSF